MIKTIIVDDEPAINEEMFDLLKEYEGYEVVGTYTKPMTVIDEANSLKPDLAFLDIEMMGMNGIELAEKLVSINPLMEIVFVTAYNHYAVQAFEINAIDYLLKPVSPERLKKTLERMDNKIAYNHRSLSPTCKIKCFGVFEVCINNRLIKWNRAKTRELFAYLIHFNGKSVSKYVLCDKFWAEHLQEQALSNLQTSMWAIRKKFKELGYEGIRIDYSDNLYFIYLEGVEWEADVFEKNYREFKKTGNKVAARLALESYNGEYMEGEEWLWVYPERAKYVRKVAELRDFINNKMN